MRIHSRGKYKAIIIPTHPYADKRGRVGYHRYIVEQEIGRYLLPTEIVHHIDGDVDNNDPLNLEITNHSEHTRRHKSTGVTYVFLECAECRKKFEREKRKISKNIKRNFCSRSCANKYYVPKRIKKIIEHNTEDRYRQGCRCPGCKKAHNKRIRDWRNKRSMA